MMTEQNGGSQLPDGSKVRRDRPDTHLITSCNGSNDRLTHNALHYILRLRLTEQICLTTLYSYFWVTVDESLDWRSGPV